MAKEVFILLENKDVYGVFSSEEKAIKCVEQEIGSHSKEYDYVSHYVKDADSYRVGSVGYGESIGYIEMRDYTLYYELMLHIIDEPIN